MSFVLSFFDILASKIKIFESISTEEQSIAELIQSVLPCLVQKLEAGSSMGCAVTTVVVDVSFDISILFDMRYIPCLLVSS